MTCKSLPPTFFSGTTYCTYPTYMFVHFNHLSSLNFLFFVVDVVVVLHLFLLLLPDWNMKFFSKALHLVHYLFAGLLVMNSSSFGIFDEVNYILKTVKITSVKSNWALVSFCQHYLVKLIKKGGLKNDFLPCK